MRRTLLTAALLAVALFASPTAVFASKAPGRTSEVVVRRAFIPSATNVHGEVRWIRRGGTTCLQTLLYTRSLRRGIDAMRKKEMKAWPAGSEGYADSSRYVTMLEETGREAIRRFDARKDKTSRLQTMAIEFTISENGAGFATFMLEIERKGDEVTIKSMEPIAATSGSREYVLRAIRLQAEAAFGEVPQDFEAAIGERR